MQINLVFDSFEEMEDFARGLMSKRSEPAGEIPAAAEPEQVEAPAAPDPSEVVTSVPVAAHEYTLDEIALAATTLMDAGRQAELISLLGKFGVDMLPKLPKEQYGAFATALREMGANI